MDVGHASATEFSYGVVAIVEHVCIKTPPISGTVG